MNTRDIDKTFSIRSEVGDLNKTKNNVTIKQIAEQAGVSIGTVSRIINHQNVGYSQETYDKVMEIINKSGYVPNRIARSMVTKKSYMIGYMVDDLANPFFPETARGIEEVAGKAGYNLILCESGKTVEQTRKQLRSLYETGVDGIIAGSYILNQVNLDFLMKNRMPFVIMDANMSETYFNNISIDNYNGARQMVEYLVSCGHKKIACITGIKDGESSTLRLNGYKSVMAENGFDWDGLIAEGDFTVQGGIDAVASLEEKNFTAIFALNDLMAIGAGNYLQKKGYRIPDDISIAGFDDIQMSSYVYPPLTTVHQPLFEMGQEAAKMLLETAEAGIMGMTRSKKYELSLVTRKSVRRI